MKKLYLMIGIPGSGKSTWARNRKDGIIVSRDAIRCSFLKDGENYFSKEDLVIKDLEFFTWEKLDKVDEIKKEFNL